MELIVGQVGRCLGTGGVSRGAQNAGFKVARAVDKDPTAWETYAANFPKAKLHRMPIDEFIQRADESSYSRIDVLHLSPPCQYFSPAHTRPSQSDEQNIDALTCCSALINNLRPRLVTVEQTFGLTFRRHREYLNSLIGDLTSFGFSVRWKVVDLRLWGSVQSRKRLIIIAAGPGERLPLFPSATHSNNNNLHDGLIPYTTIRKALEKIQHGDELHDLSSTKRFHPRRTPLSFDAQVGTICTGGNDFYYPDGSREYTLREYACLQGFPISHVFRGTKGTVKRHIGNAFPPNTVKILYKHLERCLLRQDRVAAYQPLRTETMTIE
ncbi:hypothetical protein UVI_02055450 [Ustilaginoidea virens]|uniref:DNA (cytosine-5-)-methyltransferase n=1 Tax=Ustilaginoidea virens TaxID=1159556 RepID=A0A1B5KY22_USTVR|nr:hypothetical protein UVI_02055450 [Ustilaginoidea virens]